MAFEGDVEIDESLFGRRCKYHHGNPHVGLKVWIFGVVERSSNRLLLFPVDQRDAETLIPIIRKHVRPGSRIFSDSWGAYGELNQLGYEHFSVSHKHTFQKEYQNVRTKEIVKVNTNTIEGAWKHAKDHFRKINGTSLNNFEAHLAEVVWRNWHRGSVYTSFFELVKRYYTLDGPPHLEIGSPLFQTWSGAVRSDPENTSVLRVDSSADDIPSQTPNRPSPPITSLNSSGSSDDDPAASAGAGPSTTTDTQITSSVQSGSPLSLSNPPQSTSTPRAACRPSTSKAKNPKVRKGGTGPSGCSKAKKLALGKSKWKGPGQKSHKANFCPQGFAPVSKQMAKKKKQTRKPVNPSAKSAFVWTSPDSDFV